jgi:UDP-N-acetylmuramoylalanine--D-glutamate ligase
MKIAILGYGREGKSNLKFLEKKYPKAKFSVLDKKLDPDYLRNLEDFDIICRSPGVPYNLREIEKAAKNGVEITSAIKIFLEGARGTTIGITGTKGKGTTATLIYEILKDAKRDVHLLGNIGNPALDFLSKLRKNSISIIELSSFQLWDVEKSPHIAVVLDVFPDHLDIHKNFKEYFDAKTNITKFQNKNDLVFYFSDNKLSKKIANRSIGEKIAVAPSSLPLELNIPGEHNLKNATMAAAITSRLGISPVTILKTIKNFSGLPYRLQYITTINGIKFYNDSASTNPQTTIVAVKSFPHKQKILITGGREKNLNYKLLIKELKRRDDIRSIILFGENKEKFRKALYRKNNIKIAKNLKDAVSLAFKSASSQDIVIFSPGAASFDMFTDYVHRGKEFNRIVKSFRG